MKGLDFLAECRYLNMLKRENQVFWIGAIVLLINPWTMDFWGIYVGLRGNYLMNFQSNLLAAYCILDAWLLYAAVALLLGKRSFGDLFKNSASFLAISGFAMALMMLIFNPIYAGKLQWLRIIFPLMILFLTSKAFFLGFVKQSGATWRMRLRPLATVGWAILSVLLVLEGIFMFVAKSSINDTTLASKIWFARHWQLTEDGFREAAELSKPDVSRSQLLFIGDSFLAGHGIKNPSDRFSDLIQVRLGSHWQVHNHGQNGSNTEMQSDQINWHVPKPKLTVLCWYVNDIQDAAESVGLKTGNTGRKAPFPISLFHGSYVFNFLFNLSPDTQAGENYLNFLQRSFSDEMVMAHYAHSLVDLESNCTGNGSKFAVVLFPMMNLVEGSEFALQPMRRFWQGRNVPCLDLSPFFKPFSATELTVNSSDSHPSKFAHSLAADAIEVFLKQNGLLME